MTTSVSANPSCRVVLVDFDWQDTDLIPELLQRPGVTVRLVAGARQDDPGVRLAELCGLPRTVDLADLTREIFDLALVSERSPRRTQIESLLLALGTPSVAPDSFVHGHTEPDSTPAVEAPLELHAAAFETALGGEDFDSLVERALPDVSPQAPTAPEPVIPRATARVQIASLEDFPSPEDRAGLEAALQELMQRTGANCAEVRLIRNDEIDVVVEVGPQDPLLKGLVALASELGTPQVVKHVTGPDEGKAWGAWPFRTATRRGVVAAGAIDPAAGWTTWQHTVEELRGLWDERDRQSTGAAFPMVPGVEPGWLEPDEFSMRLELALERNRHDGMRFALHRLVLSGSFPAMDLLAKRMPEQLRSTDSLCRPNRRVLLILTAGPRDVFLFVQRRIQATWQEAWTEAGNERPIPEIEDERIELDGPEGAEHFLAQAGHWLSSR